ncbi:hypothetical protein RJ639_035005, partial [Escallonia herrerae]
AVPKAIPWLYDDHPKPVRYTKRSAVTGPPVLGFSTLQSIYTVKSGHDRGGATSLRYQAALIFTANTLPNASDSPAKSMASAFLLLPKQHSAILAGEHIRRSQLPVLPTIKPKSCLSLSSSTAQDKERSSNSLSYSSNVLLSRFHWSGGLGGLIATTQLIAALANPSKAAALPEIAKGLAIDIGAISIFAFLYFRENTAKNAQLARLSREESLSNLKLRVDQKKTISLNALRGIARLSFRLSEPFTEGLLERGVLVVPFATDGVSPAFEFEENEDTKEIIGKRKGLWQLSPVYVTEWSKWLDEQKKLANISPDSPVYLSLRMDGRVRGSGVGNPPWNAFVAQLPPVKGIWSGVLDGMDGRDSPPLETRTYGKDGSKIGYFKINFTGAVFEEDQAAGERGICKEKILRLGNHAAVIYCGGHLIDLQLQGFHDEMN